MKSTFIYIFIMAAVTYAVRVIPLVFFHGQIRSCFFRSFLHYVPYVTLSVMTFPAILNASGSLASGLIGFAVAVAVSLVRGSLPLVAACCCLAVYLAGLI